MGGYCCAEERSIIKKVKTPTKIMRSKSPPKSQSKRDSKHENELRSPIKTAGAVSAPGSAIKVLETTLQDIASKTSNNETAAYEFYEIPLKDVVGIPIDYQVSEVAAAATYMGNFLE